MTRASRPLPGSAALSVLAGAGAVLLVADAPVQRTAVLTALVGLVAVAGGIELAHRDRWPWGLVTGVGGGGIVLGALGQSVARTAGVSASLELLPGIVGLLILVLGLGAAVPGRERSFITIGTGMVLLGVFFSGIVYGASMGRLLAATVATVVAWDLGEQAVNLGEHVGRQARTWQVEAVHGGAAVLVGVIAVVAAFGIYHINITGVPLGGLSALLVGGVVLAVALYN